ncbi:MAG: extracellular solute-binding protein [Gammaproteobacteria bacterium]|nr:extracellular solute-binding protein [Gammaproteobacteria bacterium]
MKSVWSIALALSCLSSPLALATETLRVFTWEGYVTPADLEAVNKQLAERKLDVKVEVIQPFATGPEQMFDILRAKKADLSFLTLNYIGMQEGRIANLLQPIDTARLKNYGDVNPKLGRVGMGMAGDKPLYVPYGGGAYGLWANMKQLKAEELPTKLSQLLEPRWKGKLSLTSGQVQPNVALAFMAQGEEPFKLNSMVKAGQRQEAVQTSGADAPAQAFLNTLYGQVGEFWDAAPAFKPEHQIVASYGIEIAGLRAKGEDWQLVPFAEGNTVWMDTMNIAKDVSGARLDAAYVFMDYFLTPAVQDRVVNGLSMVAVVGTVKNPLLESNPDFFSEARFWPPYERQADNLMRAMSDAAMKARGK